MADRWTPTDLEKPPMNAAVEWIAPNGDQMRGKFCGVWIPDGSPMYVYYTPVFWRLVKEQPSG